MDPTARQLIFLLCAVGVLVAVTSYYALSRAEMAAEELRAWWENNKAPDYFGPDVVGRKPGKDLFPFLRPWNFLPALFCVAWLLIAYLKITEH
jgi:hypothetical protein